MSRNATAFPVAGKPASGPRWVPLAGFPATGKAVEFRDMTILRLRDGKIIEQRGLSDLLSVYLQLGLIQPPAPDGTEIDA